MLHQSFPPCPDALIGASLQRVTTFAGLPQISSPSRGEKHPTFAPSAVSSPCPAAAREGGGLGEKEKHLREVLDFPKNNSRKGTGSGPRSIFALLRTTERERRACVVHAQNVSFRPGVSLPGVHGHPGAPGQRLPALRHLWLAADRERRGGEADGRGRQAATPGQTAPEGETEHHSGGSPGGAPHCAAQTSLGARQAGRNS